MHGRSPLIALLAAGALLFAAARAEAAGERELEASLVHLPVSLEGVKVYSRQLKRWQPLPPSRARVRVINLWSKVCAPCLAELPELTKLAANLKQKSGAVQFLFVADPPDQTSAEDVVQMWTSPFVDALSRRCPGAAMVNPSSGAPSCLLKKDQIPDSDPAHRESAELPLFIASPAVDIRPITLLVDESGIIRQAFVGSLLGREELLRRAVERMLAIPSRSGTQGHHAAISRRPGPKSS